MATARPTPVTPRSTRSPAIADDAVWIGLDVGTQGARALAVTADGAVAGSGSRPLESRRAGDRHEQDPAAWWPAAAGACRDALADVDPGRVRAVATCATSGTIVLVDRAGAPLTPGLMYDDGRAGEQARRIGAIAPSWALPKLLWMLEHRPERARGARLAHQSDVITRALTGADVATDESHALKSGYDLERRAWPQERLGALGVPAGLLPPVVPSGSRLGAVCAAAADATAIPAGTPVIAGMTDGCAAQLAAGAVGDGRWSSVLGTTLVLKGCSARRIEDAGGVLYCHRAPGGGWLPGGASSSGAGVLAERFAGRDLDELGLRAAAHADTRVLAYPLAGRGERFPFAAPEATAFVVGEPAGEDELFAALLQGLAYVERLCFDYVALLGAEVHGTIGLTGGATRSRLWCRLRADTLERPLRLVERAEPALGMAILAAAAAGGEPVADVAGRMVRTRELVEPRSERAALVRDGYRRFVAELERRGWLDAALAGHARAGAGG